MSLILGIIKYDDDTIDEGLLQAMYEPLKDFPQVRFDKISIKEASFGKILNYGTPEDVFDSQPIYLSEQNILFTAQGRIDNRDELAKVLGINAHDTVSDSYFMLQAYLKYREEVQHKLKGEWSLAVYKYNTKELFLARDTQGYTVLYFYKTDKYFAFSTSLKSILALPVFKKELNEEYFVSALSLWKVKEKFAGNETFYQNVFYLQGGFLLKFKNRDFTINQYWPPENVQETHYKNKQDYSDEMSGLIYKAVDRRLRSYKPVASMLSGGLDSSMVSYIAADLLKQQNKTLTTYSHVPLYKQGLLNDPMAQERVLDETPFIEATVKASGNINAHYLNSAHVSPLQGSLEFIDILDGFIHGAGNAYWLTDIYKTCAQQGYGVLLTGEGGNGSTSFAAIDYRQAHNFQRFIRNPINYLRRQVAKPLVLKYFSAASLFNTFEKAIRAGYTNTRILERYNIMKDVKNKNEGFLLYYQHVLESKKSFINYYHLRSVLGASFGNYYGIELRDPTTDIDVMNFFLTIPNDVFFDDHFNNKMLVKRMMHNKMPDKVLFARKKGLQSSDLIFRVRNSKEEMHNELSGLKKSPLVMDYIDMDKLEKNLKMYLDNDNIETTDTIHLVMKTMQAASFLQRMF
jgi:asparagine synthase (glutamine-hydrolysing)